MIYKNEYIDYLLSLSINIDVENYSEYNHQNIVKLLFLPRSFGYKNTEYDLIFNKAYIILEAWSKEVMSYPEFIQYKRDNKLKEIGIDE